MHQSAPCFPTALRQPSRIALAACLCVSVAAVMPIPARATRPEGTQPDVSQADTSQTRTISGRYVEILTDVPDSPETRRWADVFDAAVPQWCEFWQVPLEELSAWRVQAYVMTAKEPFARRGLIPPSLPDFPHGYQLGNTIWVVAQASDYYTRHLLLHEGAHAFASQVFGGAGPPWYMEGTAEFLATHRWDGERLSLGVLPESKTAFPYWGRFKMIDQRRREGRTLSLQSVLRYSDTAHRQVEPYAWTWAAVTLMSMEPETREVLLAAARQGSDGSLQFTRNFVQALGDQWPLAQARWRVLVGEWDYGYDLPRNRFQIHRDDPLWDGERIALQVAADRGWQSAGVRLRAGQQLRIVADGRVVIDDDPQPWIVEPQGVTIEYHDGHPLGELLGLLLPTKTPEGPLSPPLEVVELGRVGRMRASEESWLLFKVGDAPSALADNRGSFTVEITSQ